MTTTTAAVACNLCGTDDAAEVFAAGVAQISRIVRCNRCGLMYANPRGRMPDHVAIATWDADARSHAEDVDRLRYEKEMLQIRDFARSKALLAQLHPQRGRLIEVGCGLGFLLDDLRQDGWDVAGVEPDRGYCQFMTKRFGIPASPAILEEAGLPDASADVVVLLHVIEHVPDPVATLREIGRVLKPGGHLILETPRYDSLTFKLLGRRERSVSCDGHIYFFTTDSLARTCAKAGFEPVETRFVGRSLSAERLAWNLGVVSKSKRLQGAMVKTAAALRLNALKLYLNVRDMQRLCVRKPAD